MICGFSIRETPLRASLIVRVLISAFLLVIVPLARPLISVGLAIVIVLSVPVLIISIILPTAGFPYGSIT